MYYKRKIDPEVLGHLDKKQITVITGMRRTGKTTLVKHLLAGVSSANKIYFDLEKITHRELFAEKEYDNIIRSMERQGLTTKEKLYVAIDEIQLLPTIASTLKYLYDTYDIKFVITGSSSYYLKHQFSESLAGRKKIFELWPLDFGEFLTFRRVSHSSAPFLSSVITGDAYERLKSYYEEYVKFGGFPEVVLSTVEADKRSLLEDILSSYINIDIKFLSDFRDVSNITNLVRMLGSRVGTRLDYAKLASLTGLSRATVENYVDLFSKTYLISLIPVHTKSRDREIVKAKKIYFSDTGFLGIAGDVSSGSLFKNALYNQLMHHGEIRYYALKTGREIDFVLDGALALEAKETPTAHDAKELASLAGVAGLLKSRIVGRHTSPVFHDYIWGGDIL